MTRCIVLHTYVNLVDELLLHSLPAREFDAVLAARAMREAGQQNPAMIVDDAPLLSTAACCPHPASSPRRGRSQRTKARGPCLLGGDRADKWST